MKQKVLGAEKKVGGLESLIKNLEVDVEDVGKSFDSLEATVENLDNFQRKNNLKILGLKEKIEGQDLSGWIG